MGQYEKKLVERLETVTDILKSKQMRPYCLTHTYDEEVRRFYVSAPYYRDEFEAICAYIQFECSELEESYSMDQSEVIEILEKFYDCKTIEPTNAAQVDLYLNWEYFCGSNVQSVECLKRDGMDEFFKKYIENFYVTHPSWRPVAQ